MTFQIKKTPVTRILTASAWLIATVSSIQWLQHSSTGLRKLEATVMQTSRGSNNSAAPVNASCAEYSEFTACTSGDNSSCLACGTTNYQKSADSGSGYDTPASGGGSCGSVYSGKCVGANDCQKTMQTDDDCDAPPGVPPAQAITITLPPVQPGG